MQNPVSGISDFFHMPLGGPSRSALWNEVLYIHCDFHSNLYRTSDSCTGNFASSVHRPLNTD